MDFQKGLTEGTAYAHSHKMSRIRRRQRDFTEWLTSANGDHRFDEYARGYLAGLDRP